MKHILTILAIFLITFSIKADGILISWGPKDMSGMSQERFEKAKKWTVKEIIEKNLTVDEWPEIYLLLIAANENKKDIVLLLIDQLEKNTQIKLKNTSRLVIWERITLGDIFFEGKGMQISDDLFSVAGRANWLLRNITDKNFGLVKPTSTAEDLKKLKSNWRSWKNGKKVDEYKNPFEHQKSGLDEIKSKEALEAIIVSLKSSPEKEALIKNCLKKLYNLDEMPSDSTSPANFCSPDSYANAYLVKLTEITEKHDYIWWSNWWMVNHAKLVWESKEEHFRLE